MRLRFSHMLCEYGMGVWNSNKKLLIGAGITTGRMRFSFTCFSARPGWRSHLRGRALPHGLSYYLTYEKGIPHGKAVGYFLPGYLSRPDR